MADLSEIFPYKRVLVTGGAGFLGRFIANRLRGYPDVELFLPSHREYDLVEASHVKRLLSDTHESRKVLLRESNDGRSAY